MIREIKNDGYQSFNERKKNMFFEFLDQSAAGNQQASIWQGVLTIGIWVVVIGVAYFLLIRPQRKKQKAEDELRNNIEIGDDVTTIGGIVGRIIAVRDDDETIVIETGNDKTRMRFKKWAISSVDTPGKQPADPKEQKKKAKKEKEDKNLDIDESK